MLISSKKIIIGVVLMSAANFILGALLVFIINSKVEVSEEKSKSKHENILNHSGDYFPVVSSDIKKIYLDINDTIVDSNGIWLFSENVTPIECSYPLRELYMYSSTIVDGPIPKSEILIYVNNTWYLHKKASIYLTNQKTELLQHINSCIKAFNARIYVNPIGLT